MKQRTYERNEKKKKRKEVTKNRSLFLNTFVLFEKKGNTTVLFSICALRIFQKISTFLVRF